MFHELTKLKRMQGHCNVPVGWLKNQKLGSWLNTQRSGKKYGRLDEERKRRLERIGVVWERTTDSWNEMFVALQRFKRKFGHCDVPQSHQENPQLGRWASKQRQLWKRGRLIDDRARRLDNIGFARDARNAAWDRMFAELGRFRRVCCHCNVPRRSETLKLARWVGRQKKNLKDGKISRERQRRLLEIGLRLEKR